MLADSQFGWSARLFFAGARPIFPRGANDHWFGTIQFVAVLNENAPVGRFTISEVKFNISSGLSIIDQPHKNATGAFETKNQFISIHMFALHRCVQYFIHTLMFIFTYICKLPVISIDVPVGWPSLVLFRFLRFEFRWWTPYTLGFFGISLGHFHIMNGRRVTLQCTAIVEGLLTKLASECFASVHEQMPTESRRMAKWLKWDKQKIRLN